MITFPNEPVFCDFAAIVPIFYLLPSYGLFGLINYTMHFGPTRKQYNGPFFTLFTMYTIVAVFISFGLYFHGHFLAAPMFLPLVTAMPKTGPLPTCAMILLYYSVLSGQLVNTFITVNRFTVIFLKTKYPFFWRKFIKVVIVFVFTAPILVVCQFPFTNVEIFLVYPPIPEMGYHIREDTAGLINKNYIMIATFVITAITSIGMNLYISYFIIQSLMPSGGRGAGQDHDESSPTNVRFFAFNIFLFLLEICTVVLQTLLEYTISPYFVEPHLFFVQIYVAELNALGPAWFMFLINTPLRNDIFSLLQRKSKQQRTITVSTRSFTVAPIKNKEAKSMF